MTLNSSKSHIEKFKEFIGTIEASKVATGSNDELRFEIHGDKCHSSPSLQIGASIVFNVLVFHYFINQFFATSATKNIRKHLISE